MICTFLSHEESVHYDSYSVNNVSRACCHGDVGIQGPGTSIPHMFKRVFTRVSLCGITTVGTTKKWNRPSSQRWWKCLNEILRLGSVSSLYSGVFLPWLELRGERRPLIERSGSLTVVGRVAARAADPFSDSQNSRQCEGVPSGSRPPFRLVCLGSSQGSPSTMTFMQARVVGGRPRDLLPSVAIVEDEWKLNVLIDNKSHTSWTSPATESLKWFAIASCVHGRNWWVIYVTLVKTSPHGWVICVAQKQHVVCSSFRCCHAWPGRQWHTYSLAMSAWHRMDHHLICCLFVDICVGSWKRCEGLCYVVVRWTVADGTR